MECMSNNYFYVLLFSTSFPNSTSFFFLDFTYLFVERGDGREKERERNISVWLPLIRPLLETGTAMQACALTANRTHDPLVHRPALNPLSHTSQGPNSTS